METFEKLYNNTLRFLSFRPRSEKEIRDYLKLKTKNLELEDKEDLIKSIIEKLKGYKFLDDVEFARRWIEQRTKLKPKAWRLIKLELKQKGITDEIIDSITADEELTKTTDMDSAYKLAQRRIERLKDQPRQKKYEKMFRYLSSKGFDYDTIKQVIDRILPKEYNNN